MKPGDTVLINQKTRGKVLAVRKAVVFVQTRRGLADFDRADAAVVSIPECRRHSTKPRDEGCCQCVDGKGLHCPGYLHMGGSTSIPIQRCDECAIYPNDDEAQKAHANECGCSWGKEGLQ